jgi:hypothetical protein
MKELMEAYNGVMIDLTMYEAFPEAALIESDQATSDIREQEVANQVLSVASNV